MGVLKRLTARVLLLARTPKMWVEKDGQGRDLYLINFSGQTAVFRDLLDFLDELDHILTHGTWSED